MSEIPESPDDAYAIANRLSDMHIAAIAENDKRGGKVIAERVRLLRDAVWSKPEPFEKVQDDQRLTFQKAVDGLDNKQRTLLLEAYAQMGNINEIANLAAREAYFIQLKKDGKPVPGGVEEFVTGQHNGTTAEIVEKLNQPVFEPVLTAHPTNVNSLESIKAQRGIAVALNDRMRGSEGASEEALKKAIKDYTEAPLLNRDEKTREDKNFTVRDETKMVINSLNNIYEDLPRIYKEYDEALAKKNDYKPEDLNLKIRLKSWGSAGDKDGNTNVTAEKTLEAIALHTKAVLDLYINDLGGINNEKAAALQKTLEEARDKLDKDKGGLLARSEQLSDRADAARAEHTEWSKTEKEGDLRISGSDDLVRDFDRLSKELADLRAGLDSRRFQEDLKGIYDKSEGETKIRALDLLRKARTFGFEFAKIEYRETAEEYTRVVGEIVGDEYKNAKTPEKRAAILTRLLLEEGAPQRLYQEKQAKVEASGADKGYDKTNALPITYHTMKRMELVRDHPAMFEDNVLAECGKLPDNVKVTPETVAQQGVANFLEAQFIQQAASKNGKRPLLGIVPLFEEPDTMIHIDKIMGGVYDSDAYQHHLKLLADNRHGGRPTQQVQIAQSDNARRAGIPAARAFIHEASKKLKDLNEKTYLTEEDRAAGRHMTGQLYIGGSISDAYRNGVRALSASVNAFGMHKFAKFTFQGGDMLNYFNTPFSNTRLFTRQFVHSAEKLKKNGEGWTIEQDKQKMNSVMDTIAIEALKNALHDYKTHDFVPGGIGTLLASLNYQRETAAGSVASRSPVRPGSASAASGSAQGIDLTPIAMDKLRTISFSEAMQHNDLLPSWVGAIDLANHIKTKALAALDNIKNEGFSRKNIMEPHSDLFSADQRDFFLGFNGMKKGREIEKTYDKDTHEFVTKKRFDPEKGKMVAKIIEEKTSPTPAQLHALYHESPTFRDAMDKFAYGIAMTDMDRLDRRIAAAIASTAGDYQAKEKSDLTDYRARLATTYENIGKMAYAAITGKVFSKDDFIVQKKAPPRILRNRSHTGTIAAALTQALERITPDIHRKTQYRAFPMFIKEEFWDKTASPDKAMTTHDDKVLHAALDTVVHGRMPAVDDPEYGKLIHPEEAKASYALGV